ncbi:hypothetical protein SAMD00019534_061760 [Acytostelium subglobosum LB1]|uniref:hypothetical protein n=1 Tax=Acytostelium subglobosum LB1 TaxID=1410327 RepID=UPI000644FF5A|nr:hypothetical protein SAMD00019534_061760 [Acytostelium subglobosum LB1]GAM23001.1 hypothetical protein SAMD00019534_061760 [Acytostelium subglobosum LB1]|eukprot:XP_012754228.1 hypothetical protein SAMD00019534_061760 [Acytostelium subglobosum LB1]
MIKILSILVFAMIFMVGMSSAEVLAGRECQVNCYRDMANCWDSWLQNMRTNDPCPCIPKFFECIYRCGYPYS